MLETGVPNLDLILGGGLPEGDTLLIVGPAGAGKTTLSMQMAFHIAAMGRSALYISTLSESPARLIQHLKGFSFLDERLIGKRLFLLDIYPPITQGLDKVADALIRSARERQAELVIVDGLMTIRDLYPQPAELRTFIYDLGRALRPLKASLVITSSGIQRPEEHMAPEFTMTDGILEMGKQDIGTRTVRTIRSSKMRGLPNLLGQQSLRLDSNGLTVYPRIESVFSPEDIGLSEQRVPLGMTELDNMMEGGPLAGSITLLAGALGTGKTIACLYYILEGAKRGQKSLYVSLRETPRQLIDKARAFGLDLETPIKDGLVVIFYRAPVDLSIDGVTWEILSLVDSFAPKRLALDSVVELEESISDQWRARGYTFSLVSTLRAKGVTSFVTKEVAQVVGPELDFSGTPLAVLAENLLLARYVEFRGELFRVVSILKMRDSEHDHSIRQYRISNQGFTVLPKIETAEGVLTGIARLPSEVRIKRPTRETRREERT